MSPEQVWVLGLLGFTLVLLVTEWLPAGITGLLVIAGIVLGNVVLPNPVLGERGAFLGLIDRAVIAVAGMFVISAGISRTGAVGLVTNTFLERKGARPQRHYVIVLLFVMVASAFMNNTPLVLIFMPIVLGLATRMKKAPSKILVQLSFISIMGGMCTLIGTSTNVVVAGALAKESFARTGEAMTLGMFDFAPMGLILAVSGAIYLFAFGERLLPERVSLGLNTGEGLATEYMTEIEIKDGSRFVGKSIDQAFPRSQGKIRVLQLIRHDVIHAAKRAVVLEAGDLLLVKGDPATIVTFTRRQDTGVVSAINVDEEEAPTTPTRRVAMTLVEVILTPNSRWIDRKVRDVKFRERYGVSVFAVQRHGSHLRQKVEDLRLKTGDILLVQGTPEDINHLKAAENFLVIEGVQRVVPHTQRAPIALLSVIVFVGIAMVAPELVHVAGLVAALVMVIGRCVTAAEAYDSLDWDVLFLLAGTLALGFAFAHTGLAREAGEQIVAVFADFGVTATVGALFVFTALVTQILSNNAAAAMMTPIAYETGVSFPGAEPLPFVMAVAFGASCCFLTPVGYGTNLIVYGPGGYRFTDFLRVGLPLTLLFCILATVFLPILYG